MPKQQPQVFEMNSADGIRALRHLYPLAEYERVRQIHRWCDTYWEDRDFVPRAKEVVATHILGTPSGSIFTFAREGAPELPFCTGSYELYDALIWHITHRGGLVVRNEDLPVPFAHGIGHESLNVFEENVALMTTWQEFEHAFHIGPDTLLQEYRARGTRTEPRARRCASLPTAWLRGMPNT